MQAGFCVTLCNKAKPEQDTTLVVQYIIGKGAA